MASVVEQAICSDDLYPVMAAAGCSAESADQVFAFLFSLCGSLPPLEKMSPADQAEQRALFTWGYRKARMLRAHVDAGRPLHPDLLRSLHMYEVALAQPISFYADKAGA